MIRIEFVEKTSVYSGFLLGAGNLLFSPSVHINVTVTINMKKNVS